jgi:hypothetical protein
MSSLQDFRAVAICMAPALFAAAIAPVSAAMAVRPAQVGPELRANRTRPQQLPAVRGATRFASSLPTPTGCTSDFASFVGLSGVGDYAGYNTFKAGPDGNDQGYAGVVAGYANRSCDDLSFIGSGVANIVGGDGGAFQAAITGGAYNEVEMSGASAIVGGYANLLSFAAPYANSNVSFIGGGQGNQITAPASVIGGGTANVIAASNAAVADGQAAFIGGGLQNRNGGDFASIVGGSGNALGGPATQGEYGFIGGGQSNTLTGEWAAIGSGRQNSVSGAGGFVGGGTSNHVDSANASVGGGGDNSASAPYAVIPGGLRNAATAPDTFAAGTGSWAAATGDFVWSDDAGSATQLKVTASNVFAVRASGGVVLYSDPALTSGVRLAPGSGSWASLSDRTVKTDIRALDGATVLAKVAALPVTEWTYRSEPGVRHVGPMAQDFYAAFHVGEDDRHITTIDEDGVALAAVKALNRKLATAESDVRALSAQNRALAARLARIESRLASK